MKKSMVPHDVPGRPWARVGADLFELQGQHYLLLVDYFYNLFELMRPSSSTRTKWLIDVMTSQCARQGVPKLVMSNNGPHFSNGEFREFAPEIGLRAYHEQSEVTPEQRAS